MHGWKSLEFVSITLYYYHVNKYVIPFHLYIYAKYEIQAEMSRVASTMPFMGAMHFFLNLNHISQYISCYQYCISQWYRWGKQNPLELSLNILEPNDALIRVGFHRTRSLPILRIRKIMLLQRLSRDKPRNNASWELFEACKKLWWRLLQSVQVNQHLHQMCTFLWRALPCLISQTKYHYIFSKLHVTMVTLKLLSVSLSNTFIRPILLCLLVYPKALH